MLAVRFASGLGHFQLVPARRVESQYAMPLCLEGSLRRTAISVWLVGLNRGTLITCGVWAGSCQVAEQDPGHYSTTRPPPSRCVRQVPPLRSVNGEGSACSSPPTPFGETRDPVDSFGFSCFELTVCAVVDFAHLGASPPAWPERWASPHLRYWYLQAGPR